MTPALAAAAVLLGFAAAWEVAGSRGEEISAIARRAWATLGGRSGTSGPLSVLARGAGERLTRAGLAGRVPVRAVIAGRAAGLVAGAFVAIVAAPAAPGRLPLAVAALFPVAGLLAPDALLERGARLRRRRILAALPDALDMLAVGAAAGRGAATTMEEIAGRTRGPLAGELGACAAEIAAGTPQAVALGSLRLRVGGGEVAALVAAFARSRRYGSPLADQLREQASALRRDQRRRIEEQASRAAPKIQLVVALVLVPSVLLLIVAALVANSGVLLGGF
jgi:tight adherence protein C